MQPAHADPPATPRRRLSKLAAVALVLSPLPLVATVVVVVVGVRIMSQHRTGWAGLGDLLFVGMTAQCVLIGGTILAAITAVIGVAALWRIARGRQALHGRGLAWAAILISVAWTAVAWPSAVTLYLNLSEFLPPARSSP